MSRRTEMLASTIQRELAEFIQREISDPRLPTIVSITRVHVSDDLEFADVYVSIMGTPGQQNAGLIALKHSSGLMRTRLTKALSIRYTPFLRFQIDEKLKKELAVLELIEQARRESEELERKRNPSPEPPADAETEAGTELQAGAAEQASAVRSEKTGIE